MTQLGTTRGRIVVVAIFGRPPSIDLFRVFWRELRLRGARVYEPEDFERAIDLASRGALPLARLISARRPLADLQHTFGELESSSDLMKVLVNTQGAR